MFGWVTFRFGFCYYFQTKNLTTKMSQPNTKQIFYRPNDEPFRQIEKQQHIKGMGNSNYHQYLYLLRQIKMFSHGKLGIILLHAVHIFIGLSLSSISIPLQPRFSLYLPSNCFTLLLNLFYLLYSISSLFHCPSFFLYLCRLL